MCSIAEPDFLFSLCKGGNNIPNVVSEGIYKTDVEKITHHCDVN